MKHLLVTLIALMGISYAFADTHTVTFYEDPNIVSITDQDNNSYTDWNAWGYAEYDIEDGTTITFTLVEGCKKMVYLSDDETGDNIEKGYVFTIKTANPEYISFNVDDITINVIIDFPMLEQDVCELITKVKIGTMDIDKGSICSDGTITITDLAALDAIHIESSVKIDWGGTTGESKIYDRTITQEDIDKGEDIIIGANDIWDDNGNTPYKADEKVDINYHRTNSFKGGMWNTVCFPFNLTQAQVLEYFGDKTVVKFESATFSESEGLRVECSYVTGGMEANTPYLFMPETDIDRINFKQVTVQFEDTDNDGTPDGKTIAPAGSAVHYVGVLASTLMQKDDKSVLFVGARNYVYYPDEDFYLKPFRAYFKVPVGSPAQGRRTRACIVIREEAPTALDNIFDNSNAKKYMQDGRLVIENNGIRYNAQGQQID